MNTSGNTRPTYTETVAAINDRLEQLPAQLAQAIREAVGMLGGAAQPAPNPSIEERLFVRMDDQVEVRVAVGDDLWTVIRGALRDVVNLGGEVDPEALNAAVQATGVAPNAVRQGWREQVDARLDDLEAWRSTVDGRFAGFDDGQTIDERIAAANADLQGNLETQMTDAIAGVERRGNERLTTAVGELGDRLNNVDRTANRALALAQRARVTGDQLLVALIAAAAGFVVGVLIAHWIGDPNRYEVIGLGSIGAAVGAIIVLVIASTAAEDSSNSNQSVNAEGGDGTDNGSPNPGDAGNGNTEGNGNQQNGSPTPAQRG